MFNNQIWFGFFATGLSLSISSMIHFKKYWIKTGYAFIVNIAVFFISVLVILPLSGILPYLFGITTFPLTILVITGFFVLIAGVVLYI